nr:hypothetical protein [uncultured Mediterranean phage uvMED]
MIPGNANPLLLASAAADAAAAGPIKSVRFNSADSAHLTRTPSSAGNRRTWTWSAWVKRSKLGERVALFTAATDNVEILFEPDDVLRIYFFPGSYAGHTKTVASFRDTSAWYHIVFAIDTTQTGNDNIAKIYVNGVQQEVTHPNSWTQNGQTNVNNTVAHYIGSRYGPARLINAYMADIYLIDGQQLSPTSFGAFDDSGVWQAAAYSGTYGTNGFHLLDFANESTIGHDSSGNENDFTANNLSAEANFYATAGTHAGKDGISFNGTNAEITLSSDADLNPGSGVFTLECYAYALSGGQAAFGIYDGSPGGNGSFVLRRVGAGTLMVERHSVAFDITGAAFSENTWHHVAVTRDSSNNVRLFVDGTQSGSTSTNNTHNYQGTFRLGRDNNGFTNGYISNLRLIKGTCLYTSNFTAPTGNLTNVTNTKLLMAQSTTSPTAATVKPSGVTISGSGDGSVIDVLFDVPTNGDQSDTGAGGEVSGNYPTWNPLDTNTNITLSNGNLDAAETSGANHFAGRATFKYPATGKWYYEATVTTLGGACCIGVDNSGLANPNLSNTGVFLILVNSSNNVQRYIGSSFTSFDSAYGNPAVGSVLQVAYDADADKLWLGMNNVWMGSGSSANGNPGAGFEATASNVSDPFPSVNLVTSALSVNFGQRSFSYSAPSNFKALNTASLPTPTIADGSDYFDTLLYTGTGANQSISGLSFGSAPDFVWIKRRNGAGQHVLTDSVRGTSKQLFSSLANAEQTSTTGITSFDSDGFSLGTNVSPTGSTNGSSSTYAAWCWDVGTSTVSNTDGSITSSVRVSQTAGISIVGWTASAAGSTIGHGLNAAPEMIIAKSRTTTQPWVVYHSALGKGGVLQLHSTAANITTYSEYWGTAEPSSTVFGTYTGAHPWANNAGDMVAYCFAPVESYSSMGVYTGNGSADGPFVFTGFKPRFVIIKRTDASGNDWQLYDTARSTFNEMDDKLKANTSDAEIVEHPIDFLSNGFKPRNTANGSNGSGATYIYASFASNPFSANGGLAR